MGDVRRRVALLLLLLLPAALPAQTPRPRTRDVGLVIGGLPSGPLDAITDVPGVLVGQVTLAVGDSINTGVTAVLPHGGNVFRDKVPAGVAVGNGFGKMTGLAQVRELGELESPIVLTCTLCVPRVADAVLTWLLGESGNEDVRSINVVVGETNDGFLNDIRRRPVGEPQVLEALREASGGPVAEGSVGAGRGTVAFGWKGGIGTASRRVTAPEGVWTVGVLVQTNFGGDLTIGGVRVGNGVALAEPGRQQADGSVMIVVATDAPLDARALERLAQRAFLGVARTGSWMANGSGDFAIAFSTAPSVRRSPLPRGQVLRSAQTVASDALSPLFRAVVEATEEAVINSLLRAETVSGPRGTVRALPLDSVLPILREHRAIP